MNFVNSLITDEDRKQFDFSVVKTAPRFIDAIRAKAFVVDRDAGAYLIRSGEVRDEDFEGNPIDRTHFDLWWENERSHVVMELSGDGQGDIRWKKHYIHLLPRFKDRTPELYGVIKEALSVYGDGGALRNLCLPDERPLRVRTCVVFDF